VDTGSVARDMERLRRALGDGKLNFLGLSYGSRAVGPVRVVVLDVFADAAFEVAAVEDQ
jgi:pimeloyl-ACP methyl ester carboxylesterase